MSTDKEASKPMCQVCGQIVEPDDDVWNLASGAVDSEACWMLAMDADDDPDSHYDSNGDLW